MPLDGDILSHHQRSEQERVALLFELIKEVARVRALWAELRESHLRLLPRSLTLSLDIQDAALDRIEQLARSAAGLPPRD